MEQSVADIEASRSVMERFIAQQEISIARLNRRIEMARNAEPFAKELEKIFGKEMSVYENYSDYQDLRPRFHIYMHVYSFREIIAQLEALESVSIDVATIKSENGNRSRTYSAENEFFSISIQCFLNENAICEQVQIGEEIVDEYIKVSKRVPVYDYICPDTSEASGEAPENDENVA